MHLFFAPLSERESSLLLTTLLAAAKSDTTQVFDHLPAEVSPQLKEKAQALANIPEDNRIKFMVHELKNAFAHKGLRGVERADPSWIVHYLIGETPRVVGAILMGLPPQVVRSVVKRLPPGIQKALPPRSELRMIPEALARAVRIIFEARFHPMPPPLTSSSFAFKDIIHLERIELAHLMRELGLVQLAQAFASVGKQALIELCRRLPRGNAEELILAVRSASQVDLPDDKAAQRFLSRVIVNFESSEELFKKAGLWRLAKAALPEATSFQLAFQQRLPRSVGLLLAHYLDKAREIENSAPDVLNRLQDSILLRIHAMSQRAAIGAQWQQVSFNFHDPQAALMSMTSATAAAASKAAPAAGKTAPTAPPPAAAPKRST